MVNIKKPHNIRFTTTLHKNAGYTSAKTSTIILRYSSLKHLVLLFLAVILSEQEKLMCKKINTEFWFEISVEWNHFLVRLKPLLPILLFVTCFDNISYLCRNTCFWMLPKWRGILWKILKGKYSVKELVNFIFTLLVIFMLPNLLKNLFCFAKLWLFC